MQYGNDTFLTYLVITLPYKHTVFLSYFGFDETVKSLLTYE